MVATVDVAVVDSQSVVITVVEVDKVAQDAAGLWVSTTTYVVATPAEFDEVTVDVTTVDEQSVETVTVEVDKVAHDAAGE